jgi:hypothetical protein
MISPRRIAGVIVPLIAIGIWLQIPAETAGTLAIKLQSGAVTQTIVDGDPLDSNSATGAVTFVGGFDIFTDVVATAVSKPVLGDATTANIHVTVVSSTGASGGTLKVSATDTGFPGPAAGDTTVVSSIGGTTGGVTTSQSYVHTDNLAFGTTAPVCTSGPQGPFSGAFDNTTSFPCSLSGLFSVTIVATATLGADSVQSYGADVRLLIPTSSPIGCRFTGGGVDTDGNWNHVLENGEVVRNGAGSIPAGIDRYTFGGQVGARTASQPLPSGEWEHNQHTGPSGDFSFHGGSHSAAPGTQIVDVRCSDPGFCDPARHAPAKQLDFDAIGTFSNVGKGAKAPVFMIPGANVIPEPKGKTGGAFTFHWFEVNIDDMGEPGKFNSGAPNSTICPGRGFGEKSAGPFPDPGGAVLPATPLGNCDCPDFYRITIYKGVLSTEVKYLPNGRIDPTSLNRTNIIYQSFGYIDGGNLQIHPPTGFDRP